MDNGCGNNISGGGNNNDVGGGGGSSGSGYGSDDRGNSY